MRRCPEIAHQDGGEADEMHALVVEGPVLFAEHAFPRGAEIEIPIMFARDEMNGHRELAEDPSPLLKLVLPAILGNVPAIHDKLRQRPRVHHLGDGVGQDAIEFVIGHTVQVRIADDGEGEGLDARPFRLGCRHLDQPDIQADCAGDHRDQPSFSADRYEFTTTYVIGINIWDVYVFQRTLSSAVALCANFSFIVRLVSGSYHTRCGLST
jgi:hypothetical protein